MNPWTWKQVDDEYRIYLGTVHLLTYLGRSERWLDGLCIALNEGGL